MLNGDVSNEDLLGDENVDETDLFVSVTNDDEANIMSALLAKRMGARRVIALINRRAYGDLMQGGQIDIAISPAQATLGSLLEHVRRGDVAAVHSVRRGRAEAIELIAHGDRKTSRVVGRAHPRGRPAARGHDRRHHPRRRGHRRRGRRARRRDRRPRGRVPHAASA